MSSDREKLEILKDILGSPHKVGHEYLFKCPVPTCQHHKQKLSINVEKNVFKCWICGYKGTDLKRLVRRFGTFSNKDKWSSITGETDLSISLENLFVNTIEVQEKIVLPKEFVSLCSSKRPYSSLEPLHYLKSRGITQSDILKYKIGYCKSGYYSDRIILPSFDSRGKLNYYVGRTYTNDYIPYRNPNINKDIIFNELNIQWDEDIILVEGVFDAIKAENSIPLLGSTLKDDSRLFKEILRHQSTVYVALDFDAEKKAYDLIKSLLSYDIEVFKVDVSDFKDVGEMNKETFEKRKKSAKLFNLETHFEELMNFSLN